MGGSLYILVGRSMGALISWMGDSAYMVVVDMLAKHSSAVAVWPPGKIGEKNMGESADLFTAWFLSAWREGEREGKKNDGGPFFMHENLERQVRHTIYTHTYRKDYGRSNQILY